MADKIRLEIEISPEGEVRIVTHGLQGESCVVEAGAIERALGDVVERKKTSEYYGQSTKIRQSVREKK